MKLKFINKVVSDFSVANTTNTVKHRTHQTALDSTKQNEKIDSNVEQAGSEHGNNNAAKRAINNQARAHKEPVVFRDDLFKGKLIDSVDVNEKVVTLNLKAKFNKKSLYKPINKMLYDLYGLNSSFQDKFEKPKQSEFKVMLILKDPATHTTNQALLDDLQGFAMPKKRINKKNDLHKGELIERAEIIGKAVTLHLNSKYNTHELYRSVNKVLCDIYCSNKELQEKIEKPKVSYSKPELTLKYPGAYADGQTRLKALQEFAAPKNPASIDDDLDEESAQNAGMLEPSLNWPLVLDIQTDDVVDTFPSNNPPITSQFSVFQTQQGSVENNTTNDLQGVNLGIPGEELQYLNEHYFSIG